MKKDRFKNRTIILTFIGLIFMFSTFSLMAQEDEKNKVRLKADYFKVMDSISYINLVATSRIDGENTTVPNIELLVQNETENNEEDLGALTTNSNGEAKFVIKDLESLEKDSLGFYNFNISFKGNDSYSRASKSLSIKNVGIIAEHVVKDSLNYITATLINKVTDSIISEESLSVQVQRLIRPLRIGEEFNFTDENGTILVPIEEGIPGVDGNLILEVVLKDHEEYGNVKALVKAAVGVPIKIESTYDQRTMWSPRNKTPWFILIFTNLLIISVWGIIVYLILNLFKINRS